MSSTRRRRLATALTAAAVAAVLLTGCGLGSDGGQDNAPAKEPAPSGTGPYPEPTDPTPAAPLPSGKTGEPKGGVPRPSKVDQRDATAVSRAGLTALATYDTLIDASRNDAGRRTAEAGWCTTAYAAQLREAVSRSAPGAEWETWASHRAYTRVALEQAEEAGRPRDTGTTAYRQWIVTITPTGRDNWKGTPESRVAFVELTRSGSGAPWRLNAVTLQ